MAAAAEQFPESFGRISGMLLERIGGPYADAVRELARPDEEAVLAPPEQFEEPAEQETSAPVGHPEDELYGWVFDPSASGKLYQPMLFVGLGGTGCDIGAELERRLRDAICGQDGNDFRRRRGKGSLLPYQLPSCVQFVYADLNQNELRRLPERVVPGSEHLAAAGLTAGYVQGPVEDSYPDLARRLRLTAAPEVKGWLPPASGDEPKVNPLHRGSGQFPTVGRAALFGTLLEGRGAVIQAIGEAVGKLSASGEDLFALGGRPPKALDVFVAFSVAGGTGAGFFYDYLHIIADIVRRQSGLRVRIYPLVLMPSAFPEGLGGGRPVRLNAGRALLDLFRLVDKQNGAEAEDVAVTYPDRTRIVMAPGTLETGLLFSQPAAASREDMHRSIASLVLSLVGTEPSADDSQPSEYYPSFADSFVGQSAHRQVPAGNGIGGRGVSTALVASLSVPVDEIAGIIAARLLSTAISQIADPGSYESTRANMEEFLTRAGVDPVLRRQGVPFSEPEPTTGARNIAVALNDRREAMRLGIESLEARLAQDVPALAERFDPGGAAGELLAAMDVFRLERIVFGNAALRDEVEQGGVYGLLQRRRAAPAAPPGIDSFPRLIPELRDRLARRSRWRDEEAVAARNTQDAWYRWQTHVVWARTWDAYTRQWTRPLDQLRRDVSALTHALSEFAARGPEDFQRRSAELYRKRVGVSYLLPSGSGRMEQFYQQVVRLMMGQLARDQVIGVNSSAADLVTGLVGADTWAEVYRVSAEQSPERAVEFLRERVRAGTVRFLLVGAPGELPLLPRLRHALVDFAGQSASLHRGLPEDYLGDFAGKLAGLVPANFTPQGSGPLKVLVTYAADAPSDIIERFLERLLNLPSGPGTTHEFRATSADAITVVLFRTTMGVTEVDEVRDVLRLWASAQADPRPADLLRWRQRTGYDFGYLATREHDRVEILHRILCALWNGKVTVVGPEETPSRINLTLAGGVTMTLPVASFGRASSWASLLGAYELWALDDDDIRRQFCGQLMRELPDGLDSQPRPPHEIYLSVREMAAGQLEILDDMLAKVPPEQRSRVAQLRSFWATTYPSALDLSFTGLDTPVASNLRDLERDLAREVRTAYDGNHRRPRDDAWIAAIHASPDDFQPRGSGIVIDDRRILTCAHVVEGLPGVWVDFPKAESGGHRTRRQVESIVAPDSRSRAEDLVILVLAAPVPVGVTPAPLRFPRPVDLIGNRWWAFGFPSGDPLGNSTDGQVGSALGYGVVRLDTTSRYRVAPGFTGGGVWSPDYQAVVAVIKDVNEYGDARAITLHQADLSFSGLNLRSLAERVVADTGKAAGLAWGWSLSGDPEAIRHWRPLARGVGFDNEGGYRFRGRMAALRAIVSWLDRETIDRRVLVVTSAPGAGKSAVLGRIVTTADAASVALLPASDTSVRATIGSVACAVHAKGKTALEIAAEIARAAQAAIPERIEDFAPAVHDALSGRADSRFNVIIDSLDETASVRGIISSVILPLAQTCADVGAQVVVGTKRSDADGDLLAAFRGAETVIDLDAPAFFAEEDLAAYALATLQLEGDQRAGNPYADDAIARPVAERIATLAMGNFLLAGQTARSHGRYDEIPADPVTLTLNG